MHIWRVLIIPRQGLPKRLPLIRMILIFLNLIFILGQPSKIVGSNNLMHMIRSMRFLSISMILRGKRIFCNPIMNLLGTWVRVERFAELFNVWRGRGLFIAGFYADFSAFFRNSSHQPCCTKSRVSVAIPALIAHFN